MKRDCLSLIIVGCAFVLWIGCEKQIAAEEPAETVKTAVVSDANEPAPEIKFEKTIHDFGKVTPKTPQSCEFKFTNAGNGLLKISRVQSCCGVTAMLSNNKQEYAPGESGTVKVAFRSYNRPITMSKDLFVYSNDKKTPRVKLTIKATIAQKVVFEPNELKLSLKEKNAGCPKITLHSVDNQPFAIKAFKSVSPCITADVNSSAKATKFVLEPSVDIEKLRKNPNGYVEINVTHPLCDKVLIPFSAPPEFRINPSAIIVFNTEPKKPTKRDVWVLNNYGEDFEVESASSKNGIIKVLSQEKIGNRYKLVAEITPPVIKGKKRFFTDVFYINIKGGEKLQIVCRGFYSKQVLQAQKGQAGTPKTTIRPPISQQK